MAIRVFISHIHFKKTDMTDIDSMDLKFHLLNTILIPIITRIKLTMFNDTT